MGAFEIAAGVVGLVGGAAGAIGATVTTLNYKKIEKTKTEIRLVAFEHETRFSRLHQQRFEVLAELYRRLVRAENIFSDLMHPFQEGVPERLAAKVQAAVDAGNGLSEYFTESRIWLDEDLCALIADFNDRLRTAFFDWQSAQPNQGEARQPIQKWKDAWDRLGKEIPSLRVAIEARFRELLGVASASQPQIPRKPTGDNAAILGLTGPSSR